MESLNLIFGPLLVHIIFLKNPDALELKLQPIIIYVEQLLSPYWRKFENDAWVWSDSFNLSIPLALDLGGQGERSGGNGSASGTPPWPPMPHHTSARVTSFKTCHVTFKLITPTIHSLYKYLYKSCNQCPLCAFIWTLSDNASIIFFDADSTFPHVVLWRLSVAFSVSAIKNLFRWAIFKSIFSTILTLHILPRILGEVHSWVKI